MSDNVDARRLIADDVPDLFTHWGSHQPPTPIMSDSAAVTPASTPLIVEHPPVEQSDEEETFSDWSNEESNTDGASLPNDVSHGGANDSVSKKIEAARTRKRAENDTWDSPDGTEYFAEYVRQRDMAERAAIEQAAMDRAAIEESDGEEESLPDYVSEDEIASEDEPLTNTQEQIGGIESGMEDSFALCAKEEVAAARAKAAEEELAAARRQAATWNLSAQGLPLPDTVSGMDGTGDQTIEASQNDEPADEEVFAQDWLGERENGEPSVNNATTSDESSWESSRHGTRWGSRIGAVDPESPYRRVPPPAPHPDATVETVREYIAQFYEYFFTISADSEQATDLVWYWDGNGRHLCTQSRGGLETFFRDHAAGDMGRWVYRALHLDSPYGRESHIWQFADIKAFFIMLGFSMAIVFLSYGEHPGLIFFCLALQTIANGMLLLGRRYFRSEAVLSSPSWPEFVKLRPWVETNI